MKKDEVEGDEEFLGEMGVLEWKKKGAGWGKSDGGTFRVWGDEEGLRGICDGEREGN